MSAISTDILEHVLLECMAGCLALITGLVVVSRARQPALGWTLPLGSVYLAVGAMDLLHGIGSSTLYPVMYDMVRFIPGTWFMSRLFLLLGFAASFVCFVRRVKIPSWFNTWLPGVICGAGLSVMAGFASLTIPCFLFADSAVPRPYDTLLLPFYAYLAWRYARYSPILCAALVLDVIVQVGMSLSWQLYDTGFNVAHVGKLLAYLLVLVWLEVERPISRKAG